MPFYAINIQQPTVTIGNEFLRLLTVTDQPDCRIRSVLVSLASGSQGGLRILMNFYITPTTGGSAFTPVKRHPGAPAAQTTVFTKDVFESGGALRQMEFAADARGGQGGWLSNEDQEEFILGANGGTDGNMGVIADTALGAMPPFDFTLEFSEGEQ